MFQKLPSHPSHSLEWFIGLFNWYLFLNCLYINHFKGNDVVSHTLLCLHRLDSKSLHYYSVFNS